MNLIQIQERLKGLPPGPQTQQLLVAYANGMSTVVPPYVALSELERRNRADEQARTAEPPAGTVKDQVEQEAGLAALQQMGSMAPMGAQPQPQMPPQMPPQMAGIANAAAQPGGMQPGVMRMAGGGIVAFAEGGDSEDDEDEDDDAEDTGEEDESTLGAGYGGVDTGEFPAEAPAGGGLRVPASVQAQFAQRPQAPATQGPQTITQQRQGLQALMEAKRAAMPEAPVIATRESMARENPEMYGVLNKPIGKDFLAGLQAVQAKQAEQDAAARKQLEANRRMDIYRSLIAAGEATRGQKGLGALLGGYGKSAIPLMEARAQEAAGIDAAAIKREELLNKAKYDIEGLQRAQANGDLKAINTERMKLYETAAKLYASGNISAAKELAAIAGIEMRQIAAAAQVEAARIRAAAKGQGGGEKTTDLMQQYKIELNALLASGEPNNAITQKAAMNMAQDRIGKPAPMYRAETTAQEQADKWVQTQLLTGPRARELRALRTKDPVAFKKEVEALEAEAQNRFVRPSSAPTRNPPSTAGTPPLPPGFVPR